MSEGGRFCEWGEAPIGIGGMPMGGGIPGGGMSGGKPNGGIMPGGGMGIPGGGNRGGIPGGGVGYDDIVLSCSSCLWVSLVIQIEILVLFYLMCFVLMQ